MAIGNLLQAECFFRSIGVAFKAVQLDAGGAMAAGAEVLAIVIEYAGNFSIFTGCGVTVDAFLQAILFGANAFMHGQVSLVLEQVHVCGADDICRLYTFLAFRRRNDIAIGVAIGPTVTAICSETAD